VRGERRKRGLNKVEGDVRWEGGFESRIPHLLLEEEGGR
jgi:hypothetical protein